jgi:DNA polymerase I-like protein with 3'-5' exonuclease and polymerase domains
VITLDFETEAIVGNPLVHPPRPCGLASIGILDDSSPVYTTGWDSMKHMWHQALTSRQSLLFHNAPFDLAVGLKWLGGEQPSWERIHDTMFLLFLDDPYSHSLSLKPSADRYLDMPPEEQDELIAWILAHVPEATRKNAGAFISVAPSPLVAKYAQGDVHRTLGLYDLLHPKVPTEPYDRERRLSPILAESSRHGIRVNREKLETDIEICSGGLEGVEERIYKRLDCDPFNIGSGPQLAERLDRAGVIKQWFYTPKGRRSTAKDNLIQGIDPEARDLLDLLTYRSTMSTCLGTFMEPWYDFSESDGRVHTEWNQVANDERGHAGARTGRLSSARPNFQNPPNPFDWPTPDSLPPLPNMRDYLLPEDGHVWIKRDFSSQEIRILAHFEDGSLMRAYQADPFLDPHSMAQGLILEHTGIEYPRPDVKITGFSIIYGSGVPGLSQQLKRPTSEAYMLREAYFKAMPAAAALAASTRRRGQSGGCVTTWGGRPYYVEPPKMINERMRSFEYKLLNYLIQGSAGDQTKEVICDWNEVRDGAVFMATIHDEINASAPKEDWQLHMNTLRMTMDQDLFDVPMRSEGSMGPTWGQLKKLENEYGNG